MPVTRTSSAERGTWFSVGDRVQFAHGALGTVVGIIERDAFASSVCHGEWRAIGKGLLVQPDDGAIVHFREPDVQVLRVVPAGPPRR